MIYDIKSIMKFLPHRYPFIMIDRIIEIISGKNILAIKNVTINENFFQGHYPNEPIMPGVLVIESLAQAGAILVLDSLPKEYHGASLYFGGIDKARFRKPVVPGDCLNLNVEIIRSRRMVYKLSGVATVNEKRVAEAQLMATIGETA